MKRKLRMGMIGGGRGAFIGPVHRMVAALDNRIELVCGAFSEYPEISKASGADLFLAPERCYATFEEMIFAEALLPQDQRMDFVTIVTPNHLHFAPAKMALEHGFHIVCDKPLAFDFEQAKVLQKLVQKKELLFCLTHNYTGYPMVKEARELLRQGALGVLHKVVVEYPQGSLSARLATATERKKAWRADPTKSGAGGCIADIGTHAENLLEYITGLRIQELAADLTTFLKGRFLDDDANILLRLEKGVKGILYTSKIAMGEENSLAIRIYGEKGGLEWHQMEPNTLLVKWADRPTEMYRAAARYLSDSAKAASRLRPGHPEGYLEAFANVYKNFADHLLARLGGKTTNPLAVDYPTVEDGIRGMAFIEAALASSKKNSAWTKLKN